MKAIERISARWFSVIKDSSNEIIIYCDENNNKIGECTRKYMRDHRLRFRKSFVFVRNKENLFYVQKRVKSAFVYPEFYDPAPGGVVLASDNNDEYCAKRELEEEMGMKIDKVGFLMNFLYKGQWEYWCATFSAQWDQPIILDPDEVDSVEIMSLEEILRREKTEKFTPDSMKLLHELIKRNLIQE
ncbi:yfcD_1 [Blepharisma stoltei]|uniref:Nudix hydrolase domain-containing protein n=1 Tax=Blepharisma stoltei TaxID=1481888 RepID=A0AAU9IFN7_9CILI|nr:unnamed protein product [Blepharisma stoltei]